MHPAITPYGEKVRSVAEFTSAAPGDETTAIASRDALRQQQVELTRFKAALDQTLDCVFMFRPDSLHFVYVNRGAREQTGYSEAELLQMTPVHIKPEFDEQRFRAMVQPLLDGTQDALRFKTVHRHKDGREVPVEIALQLTTMDGGDRQFIAIVRDIAELKKTEMELREQQEINRLTLENLAEGVVACNAEGGLILFNKTAREWHGADPRAIPQELWARYYDLFEGDGSTPLATERIPLVRAFNGEQVRNAEMSIVARGKEPRFVLASGEALFDAAGHKRGAVVVMHDITEQRQAETTVRQSLHEKEVLLKEIHHRVKNNLQVVSSLLDMQMEAMSDPVVQGPLRESINRVRSMAMIHEQLYQSDTLARIDFGDYAERLVNNLYRSYTPRVNAELVFEAERVELNIETAVPCGLILNELVTNAFKHAFADGAHGALRVSVGRGKDGGYYLSVQDSGPGLPEGFDPGQSGSLGLQLVETLTYQLKGRLATHSDSGAHFLLEFEELIYGERE